MKLNISPRSILFAAVLAIATPASATPYAEVGDAGQTLSNAQGVVSGTNTITGALGATSDADLFSFSWGGGAFNARTYSPSGFLSDPQLFLFNSTGNLIAGNDDWSGFQSFISATIGSGNYFIGISSYNNDPMNLANQDMCNGNCGQTPSAGGPLHHWSSGGGTGSYVITLNAPTTGTVPEPTGLALVSMALAGLALSRRKKARKA